MNPTQTTLIALRDQIAAKQISASDVLDQYIGRIQRYNDTYNIYNEIYVERAKQQADQVDAGNITGPLAGVPIAIKNNFCTDFGKTTCCSKILADFHSPYTGTAVKKLEDAGAIILGKTNLDEFAMGSSTENSAFGQTKNPWHVDYVPGGSSGGAAAAIAADLAAGSFGSDTGGSIRQPAALCGVVGLKPTYGRVSRFGLVAFASSLDQIGPFTHTVGDAALLLNIIAGHDEKDSTSAPKPAEDFLANLDEPIKNLRIGIAKQYMSDGNHPDVSNAIDQAIKIYQDQGVQIVEVDLPHTEYGIPTYYIVATAEASSNLARYDGIRYGYRSPDADRLDEVYSLSRAQGFGDEVIRRIMLGTYVLSSGYYDAYYLRALKVRRLIKRDFDIAFDLKQATGCHAILCPTTTGPAFKAGEKTDDPLAMYMNDIYTVNANMAGIPGISLPAGLSKDGLPLAIQLLGPMFDEARLLRVARMYEMATDHHLARPSL